MVATKTQARDILPRTLARQLPQHLQQAVRLQGWVQHVRTLGRLTFLVLRDRSGTAQAVLDAGQGFPAVVEETVVELRGTVRAEPRAPGGCELHVEDLRVLSAPTSPLPVQVNRPLDQLNVRLDTWLNHRTLSLRQPQIHAVFRVQAEIVWAFREALRARGFTEIRTPKLIATGTEGGTALFPVDYFERRAFLAQSPQFYKQMLVGAGYERVFEVGPVYRAETHNTRRHLNEYTSLDVELGFIEGVGDLIDLEAEVLGFVFAHVAERCREELDRLDVALEPLGAIPRFTLAEAAELLQTRYGKAVDGDLDTEAERLLCAHARAELGSPFAAVTHYPREVRPMYALPDPQDPSLTQSFDLLYKEMEITTGGQRIHDPSVLEASIRGRGLDPADFDFYLDAFRYGMPPHGGFAIGAERLTMLMLNLSNVREATLFPRDRTRLSP